MITEDAKIAEIFNHYFANITGSLGISEDQSLLSGTNGIKDPVEKAIKKYENHPSIRKIKECYEMNQFEFKPVTVNEIHLQIQKLNPKKSSTAFLQWRSQVPAFGGARCERSEQTWGSGGLPPEKFWRPRP